MSYVGMTEPRFGLKWDYSHIIILSTQNVNWFMLKENELYP